MFETLHHWMQFAGARGPRIVATVLIAFILIRMMRALTQRLVEAAKNPTRVAQMREAQTRTMAGLVYGVGIAVIIAIAFLEVLNELGFAITPIAAVATLASLSVGFGAQHLVKDLINGFFIVLEDQYVVGDLIRVNGEVGRVGAYYFAAHGDSQWRGSARLGSQWNGRASGEFEPGLVADFGGRDDSLGRGGGTGFGDTRESLRRFSD